MKKRAYFLLFDRVFSELFGRNFNRYSTIFSGTEVGLKLFFICSLQMEVGSL